MSLLTVVQLDVVGVLLWLVTPTFHGWIDQNDPQCRRRDRGDPLARRLRRAEPLGEIHLPVVK